MFELKIIRTVDGKEYTSTTYCDEAVIKIDGVVKLTTDGK